MSVVQKSELPPPSSPTNGMVIAPLPETVAAPYGPINEAETVDKKRGRVPWNERWSREDK